MTVRLMTVMTHQHVRRLQQPEQLDGVRFGESLQLNLTHHLEGDVLSGGQHRLALVLRHRRHDGAVCLQRRRTEALWWVKSYGFARLEEGSYVVATARQRNDQRCRREDLTQTFSGRD